LRAKAGIADRSGTMVKNNRETRNKVMRIILELFMDIDFNVKAI
jgi:hypothetical protein